MNKMPRHIINVILVSVLFVLLSNIFICVKLIQNLSLCTALVKLVINKKIKLRNQYLDSEYPSRNEPIVCTSTPPAQIADNPPSASEKI